MRQATTQLDTSYSLLSIGIMHACMHGRMLILHSQQGSSAALHCTTDADHCHHPSNVFMVDVHLSDWRSTSL
jgi:hypothetical protein